MDREGYDRCRGTGWVPPVIELRESDDVLDKRLHFERLISELSARFVNIASDQVDREIEAALKQVLTFFQVDRCGLLGISPDRRRLHVTHAAYAEGINEVPREIDLACLFPWVHEKLVVRGEYVSVSNMSELPPEAEKDRQSWTAMGARSSLAIPLFFECRVSSLIVIGSLRRQYSWPPEYIPRLRLLGEIFVNALERRNADWALKEGKVRLSLATDAAGVMPWDLDMDSGRIWTTEKGKEFFGFAPDSEITLEEFLNIVHAEDREKLRLTVEEAVLTGQDNSAEYRIIRPDGSIRWVFSRGRHFSASQGERSRLMGVSSDITERKQLQERLLTAAEEWDMTFNSIRDMVMIMDREFRITRVNRATLEFFGLPEDMVIGQECFRLMHGTEGPIDGCPHKKTTDTGNHEESEIYDPERDAWFLVAVDPIFSGAGDLTAVVHTVKDITERKRAEAAQWESMERYRAMVEAYDGFIYICSQDYRVEFMNQRLIERTGRDATGELCYMALHDRDSVCPWCMNDRVFRGETVRWEVQSPRDHHWYYVVNTPILHVDGSSSKQSMIIDITDRKLAEVAMKDTEAVLRNSQRDLRKLAGKLISAQEEELRRLSRELHDDLTQKLAVIAIEAGKLEIELNKMQHVPPDPVQKISRIKEQLIKVSEDVHRISRQLHPVILDDLGLVRAIESECIAFMRREDIEIIFRAENVPAVIDKDIALCIYRVVQEGLKNVAAHSGAKNCEIDLRSVDDTLCLVVSDDGAGFEPGEVRQKPGLGLSSMRERAQLVQGDFSIRSQPEQGSVIRICVPLRGGGA